VSRQNRIMLELVCLWAAFTIIGYVVFFYLYF
jgi:hypothetical protein